MTAQEPRHFTRGKTIVNTSNLHFAWFLYEQISASTSPPIAQFKFQLPKYINCKQLHKVQTLLLALQPTDHYVNNRCASRPCHWTFLVVERLRICLPIKGTRVPSLVWEDPTCRGATKPVCHNYWACALEPVGHSYWARVPQLLKPAHLEPVLRNEKPPQWEACAPQVRVAPARCN